VEIPGEGDERQNRLQELGALPGMTNEKLVRGRQDIFYGAEFSASAGTNKPDELLTTGEEMAWLLQYRTSVQASAFTGSLSPPPCDREQYRLFRKEPCLGELGW